MLELVAIAGVAGVVVACGGKAMDAMGVVVEDAGEMLGDAGAQWLADAGDGLADAGRTMRDSSSQMVADVDAQDACGTCTASGARRTIVASEDIERLLGGSLASAAWTTTQEDLPPQVDAVTWLHHATLGDGPLLITDLLFTVGEGALYAVASGTPCFERAVNPDVFYPVTFVPPKSSRSLLPQGAWRLSGVRLLVKANETLCVSGGSGTNATVAAPSQLTWTGFRPYD